jgi:hypothetical protein
MKLIGSYKNSGFEVVADGVMDFFEKRTDLQRPGIAFGADGNSDYAKFPQILAWWQPVALMELMQKH